MGTRAHWFKGPYRLREVSEGEPGSWVYAPRLSEVREEFLGQEMGTAEVQKFREDRSAGTVVEWTADMVLDKGKARMTRRIR